jgi:hypothetical protein
MAVTIKNAVLWDVMPFGSCKNRRFPGTYEKNQRARNNVNSGSQMMIEAIISFETSILKRATRRHIQKDGIFRNDTKFLLKRLAYYSGLNALSVNFSPMTERQRGHHRTNVSLVFTSDMQTRRVGWQERPDTNIDTVRRISFRRTTDILSLLSVDMAACLMNYHNKRENCSNTNFAWITFGFINEKELYGYGSTHSL